MGGQIGPLAGRMESRQNKPGALFLFGIVKIKFEYNEPNAGHSWRLFE